MSEIPLPPGLILMSEVLRRTGLPVSTLYYHRKAGRFPQPVRLGLRSIAFREADVTAWLKAREVRQH